MNKLLIMLLFPTLILARGSIMLVGGGGENYGDWSDLPFQWFVEQADSGIIINIDVDEASSWYDDYFESFGADVNSKYLRIKDRVAANDSATYYTLIDAKGIFIEGGDQWDYVSMWKNTLVEDAIKKVFNEGGVIGGTSAGLAVLSEVFFDAKFGSSYPDQAAENCRNSDIHLDNGFFDLMPGILADSHFHPRGRIGRLVPMMAKWKIDTGEDLIGIGVDDKTALCIDENFHGIVYGKASVTIIKPTANSTCESIAGKPVKYTNLRFDQLVHGIEYDLNNLSVINIEKLNSYNHENQDIIFNEISLNGNDDGILSVGSVKVNRLTTSETNAWYGNLTLSDGDNQIPNSVIINKIWDNSDYYENRFVGGLYAIAENPGITAIYLGENSTLDIDNQGNCIIGHYAYFVNSRTMTHYGFPQKNDPTAPIPDSNHPAIINGRLHFLNDGSEFSLQNTTGVEINEKKLPLLQKIKVGQNYPNPFNGKTHLQYEISHPSEISIEIFDIFGKEIQCFSRKHQHAGIYDISWHGINQQGNRVSAGVYYFSVSEKNSDFNEARKMLYLK